MRRTWTDEQLATAVREGKSYTDVTRQLGISVGSGGAIVNVKKGIERLKLDLSHWEFDPYRTETTKRCSACQVFKPYEDFFIARASKDGRANLCKDCKRERQRLNKWLRTHGLTLEEYEQKLEEQNGVCAICEEGPNGGRWPRLYVDHNHETGKPRGLLCSKHNLGLGKFDDNPNHLEKAAAYLRKW
jgi:hypothetical protein